MGLFGDFAGPEFGLDDVKIATLASNGTYGTAVDIPSAQMYEGGIQTVNATLQGDDQETDAHAFAVSAQVRIRFGSIPFDALTVLTGVAQVTSDTASPATEVTTMKMGNIKFPYFGVCGRAKSTQDDGDTHMFFPKVKIMEGFNFSMQYGQYVIPELTCKAVRSPLYGTIFELIKHEEEVNVTIPPYYGEA